MIGRHPLAAEHAVGVGQQEFDDLDIRISGQKTGRLVLERSCGSCGHRASHLKFRSQISERLRLRPHFEIINATVITVSAQVNFRKGSTLGGPGDTVHERVYRELRARIIGGRVVPGRGVTLRGLAAELGVSPMPVREAINRLIAERALEASPNRRFHVPEMTPERFDELVMAREKLEPEAARRALRHLSRADIARLRRIDDELEVHLKSGNDEGYVTANHAFHFAIYRAAPSDVLVPLIESLWLQFGPFMRLVYGRVGTSWVVDYHEEAIAAIERHDADALASAIRSDILDGMRHIGASVFDAGPTAPAAARVGGHR